jgi:ATP-grasp domain
MSPKILLVATNRWFATARLAMAFQRAGIGVDIVCPGRHPIQATTAVGTTYSFRGLFPLASIRSAILSARPDMVIPCDDLARSHLHLIHTQCSQGSSQNRAFSALLERSLGDPSHFSLIESRSALMQLARVEGVLTPTTGMVSDLEELRFWINENGIPIVLKTNGTSGGRGVKTATTLCEAELAFRRLNSPPEAARTIKRASVDNDWSLVRPYIEHRLPVINVQKFIPGRDATITVACWQGRVLASIGFEVLRTWRPKGPASVVKLIDNQEMQAAAEKLAVRLHLSGLYGFDFVLDEMTLRPHLIEMNPRATQTAHLALGPKRDLSSALGAALAGEPLPETPSITNNDVIALFPLEWQNDSASPYLFSAYHDVPWEQPKLVHLGVKSKLSSGWLTYENLDKLTERLFPRRL